MASIPVDLVSYASQASSLTGLSTNVILAQWISENGWAVPSGYNFGNIMDSNMKPVVYSSAADGVTAYANFLKNNSNYKGVLATAGKDPQTQINAIVASPWDAGHYQGGALINSVYNSILGESGNTPEGTGTTGASPGTYTGVPDGVITSDSKILQIFFVTLGGVLLLLGFKVITDVPVVIEGG